MIMGTALPIDNAPEETSPTTSEVVTEDDWTMAVVRIPIKRATKGDVVTVINPSLKGLPSSLKAVDIRVMALKNR
jgi:hypothetical protein